MLRNSRFAALLLTAACAEDIQLEGDEERVIDPGDPYLAAVAAVSPGTLRSDCSIGIDLYLAETGDLADSATVAAQGREWAGVPLQGDVRYQAVGTWSSCSNNEDWGTGEFESSSFSGVLGDFFVFRYTGANASIETLIQGEDFVGASAFVQLDETADPAAIAEEVGVEIARSGDVYHAIWDGSRPVGSVLSQFTAFPAYVEGEPEWIGEAPDWW